jgi:predicted RNA-binding Zn-ribbon protein involved in translation (DUF1610 family)
MDVKCLSCNGLLFKKNALDDKGNWAMDPTYKLDLQHDKEESFFKCPHCGAKNIVIDSKSPTGLPALQIIRAVKETT